MANFAVEWLMHGRWKLNARDTPEPEEEEAEDDEDEGKKMKRKEKRREHKMNDVRYSCRHFRHQSTISEIMHQIVEWFTRIYVYFNSFRFSLFFLQFFFL